MRAGRKVRVCAEATSECTSHGSSLSDSVCRFIYFGRGGGNDTSGGVHSIVDTTRPNKKNMVQLDDLVAATGSWHTQRGEHSDGFFRNEDL